MIKKAFAFCLALIFVSYFFTALYGALGDGNGLLSPQKIYDYLRAVDVPAWMAIPAMALYTVVNAPIIFSRMLTEIIINYFAEYGLPILPIYPSIYT